MSFVSVGMWHYFLDVHTGPDPPSRLALVTKILSTCKQHVAKTLAFCVDMKGRSAISVTDAPTRDAMNRLILFCRAYSLVPAAPVYKSPTTLIARAEDHSVVEEYAAAFDAAAAAEQSLAISSGPVSSSFSPSSSSVTSSPAPQAAPWAAPLLELDKMGFSRGLQCLDRLVESSLDQDFRLATRNGASALRKDDFVAYCVAMFGSKREVAIKLMISKVRICSRYARLFNAESGSECILCVHICLGKFCFSTHPLDVCKDR